MQIRSPRGRLSDNVSVFLDPMRGRHDKGLRSNLVLAVSGVTVTLDIARLEKVALRTV